MRTKKVFIPKYTEGSLSERFDSWTKQVLKNLVLSVLRDFCRSRDRLPEFLVGDFEELAVAAPTQKETKVIVLGNTPIILEDQKLASSLDALGLRKQQALEGVVVLGLPLKEVAKKLGVSVQMVSNYKWRGLHDLREMMEG